MKATVTRTLQVPNFHPIVMELSEECTPEEYSATLNRLADTIENVLRERYPDFAQTLPMAKIKHSEPLPVHPEKYSPPEEIPVIQVSKSKEAQLLDSYTSQIQQAKTLKELEGYDVIIQKFPDLQIVWKEKYIQLQNS